MNIHECFQGEIFGFLAKKKPFGYSFVIPSKTHRYLEKKNALDFVNSEKKSTIIIKQVEYCSDPFEMRQWINWQRLLEQLLVVSIWTVHHKWDIRISVYGWRSPASVAKHENLIWIKIKLIAEYWNQWPNEYAARSAAHGIIYIWKYSSNCNPQAIDAERFTNKFTIITINSVFRFILAALACSRLVCSFLSNLFVHWFFVSFALVMQVHWSIGSRLQWFAASNEKKRITQNAHENLIKNVILIAVTRFSLAFSFNFFFSLTDRF